ncbi:hypothetical protein HID58_006979 [Brassica napus]|uniref:glycerophosphodiester phosphodiesterase n=1 Tax=Brassica napus TaxID=3708 RepID=A0ABQ8EFH8_BRANA|nr:hypothetical protein HID58_006979 [Brassica napus]
MKSTDKSVLIAFNDKMIMLPGQLVYRVDEDIHNVTDSAIRDIMSFTGTIIISMNLDLPYNGGGLVRLKKTDTFSNEFVIQPLDLFSDSMVEIDFLVQRAKIDGIITDFSTTTARYRKMGLFRTGELLLFANPMLLSPSQAPYPLLVKSDVMESPLPEVRSRLLLMRHQRQWQKHYTGSACNELKLQYPTVKL